ETLNPNLNLLMKHTLKATLLAAAAFTAASPASATSIAFTAFNGDGVDNLTFVTLEAIPAGTTIFFADQEWNGLPIGSGGAFNTGEQGFFWTSPASTLPAGTVVSLD